MIASDVEDQVRREAVRRQGITISWPFGSGLKLRIEGQTGGKPEYETGQEGLVHLAHEQGSGRRWRIKCFFTPNEQRRQRSRILAAERLATVDKTAADALGGAPVSVNEDLGGATGFGVLMKDIPGKLWKQWIEDASYQGDASYPARGWPSLKVRVTWALGLTAAVYRLEQRGFVHADICPGNIMVSLNGDLALIDFDGFASPVRSVPRSNLRGTEGFAAPETWEGSPLAIGTDRTSLAIVVQQFLLAGNPDIPFKDAIRHEYDQNDISRRAAVASVWLRGYHPEIADLTEQTLLAGTPADRPDPLQWRKALERVFATAEQQGRPARAV